ncbi:E3 ubiquitin-protein ligase ATL42-like [Olea europaea var. sylvestris]|uniref:E3 ubiquitin-protein ligase ATL42-like n=1 Tax=Olea europaea var. sylvestris TaxID=158386 RepID=UPI000C1D064A|nr:E3 ubiquitin-protein ligase ATL42-like [Olea europaea var. sylvestris]
MEKFEVIFILFLFICAEAQDSSNQRDVNPLHPSMAVVLVVLLIMFCLTFLIVAYAKFCHRPVSYYQSNDGQDPSALLASRSRFSGIGRSVIESLPFFRFSSLKGSKEGLECAVCLSRFEETEVLRLLPKCKHAFHMNCIDKWLENHSSCPICRHKFDVGDLSSLTYTNSFRCPRNSCNLAEEPNIELFVQREQDRNRSSRFKNTFQNIVRGEEDEVLIQKGSKDNGDQKTLHKFKHKIIVSDFICKSRWSDVNTSDLMFLNSEMLNFMSSKRLEPIKSNSGRFSNELSAQKRVLKIKEEDMERKRLYHSKVSTTATSSSPCINKIDIVEKTATRSLNPGEKRSMSEITNISRFTELSTSNRINGLSSPVNIVKDEKVLRLWFPIARRTIQWFAGRETSSVISKHESNV